VNDPEIYIKVDATLSREQLARFAAAFELPFCAVCAHPHADHDRDNGPCFVHGCTCGEFQ
jgi:hypothetical protein